MYACFAFMYVWAPHAWLVLPEIRRGQLLELELEMVVTHHVGAGTGSVSSARAASTLNYGAISPASHLIASYGQHQIAGLPSI